MCIPSGLTLSRTAITAALLFFLANPAAAEDETQACDPHGQAIAYGDVLAGCTIEIATDLDAFTFMGTAGEHVTLILTRTGSGFPCVLIRDPNGADTALPCGNVRRDMELPVAGQYQIFVTEQFNDQTTTFNLSLERLFPLRSPTAVGPGEIIAGREILPATDIDTFQFNANAGDELRLIVARLGSGFPCAEIRRPDNTVLVPMTCSGNLDLPLGPLDMTGVYQVVITEQNNDQSTVYNLSLSCLSGTCPNPPPTCTVEGSYTGNTLHLGFIVGTPEPARWSTTLLALGRSFPVFATNLPVLDPPVSAPLDIPGVPAIGRIGIISTLTTGAGLTCWHVGTVDTGPAVVTVTPEMLERSLRQPRGGP